MWLKSSLTLFAIIPQFGAQEVTCTCHKGAKQINASEHKRRLFKDPPKDSYFVHLGTVSVQQNSLILWNCPLMVEGWARPPYVLRDWHRDASLQAVTQGTWSRSERSGILGSCGQLFASQQHHPEPWRELYHIPTHSFLSVSPGGVWVANAVTPLLQMGDMMALT